MFFTRCDSHRSNLRIIHSSESTIWICLYCSLIQDLNIEMQNYTLAFFWFQDSQRRTLKIPKMILTLSFPPPRILNRDASRLKPIKYPPLVFQVRGPCCSCSLASITCHTWRMTESSIKKIVIVANIMRTCTYVSYG